MAGALAIIEHLAVRAGRVVGVTHDLRLPWATVHRIIAQLTKADFLRRDPETKRYEIGPALWFAGATYMANHRVLRAALPYLHKGESSRAASPFSFAERVGRSGGSHLLGAAIRDRHRQGAVRLPLSRCIADQKAGCCSPSPRREFVKHICIGRWRS